MKVYLTYCEKDCCPHIYRNRDEASRIGSPVMEISPAPWLNENKLGIDWRVTKFLPHDQSFDELLTLLGL